MVSREKITEWKNKLLGAATEFGMNPEGEDFTWSAFNVVLKRREGGPGQPYFTRHLERYLEGADFENDADYDAAMREHLAQKDILFYRDANARKPAQLTINAEGTVVAEPWEGNQPVAPAPLGRMALLGNWFSHFFGQGDSRKMRDYKATVVQHLKDVAKDREYHHTRPNPLKRMQKMQEALAQKRLERQQRKEKMAQIFQLPAEPKRIPLVKGDLDMVYLDKKPLEVAEVDQALDAHWKERLDRETARASKVAAATTAAQKSAIDCNWRIHSIFSQAPDKALLAKIGFDNQEVIISSNQKPIQRSVDHIAAHHLPYLKLCGALYAAKNSTKVATILQKNMQQQAKKYPENNVIGAYNIWYGPAMLFDGCLSGKKVQDPDGMLPVLLEEGNSVYESAVCQYSSNAGISTEERNRLMGEMVKDGVIATLEQLRGIPPQSFVDVDSSWQIMAKTAKYLKELLEESPGIKRAAGLDKETLVELAGWARISDVVEIGDEADRAIFAEEFESASRDDKFILQAKSAWGRQVRTIVSTAFMENKAIDVKTAEYKSLSGVEQLSIYEKSVIRMMSTPWYQSNPAIENIATNENLFPDMQKTLLTQLKAQRKGMEEHKAMGAQNGKEHQNVGAHKEVQGNKPKVKEHHRSEPTR